VSTTDAPDVHTRSSDQAPVERQLRRLLGWVSPQTISVVYVWAALIVVFSFWIPSLFLRYATATTILNENSVSALMALALVLPLSAGTYDLSIGSVMGLAGVIAGELLAGGAINPYVVIVLVLLISACIGAVNAFVVVVLGIDSFIGTLATGSILAAVTLGVSNQQIITAGVAGRFSRFGTISFHDIEIPLLYVLVIGAAMWWVLSRTVLGRRIYAVGFNPDAARLASISVNRIRAAPLVISSLLSGLAGIVLCATTEAADPSAGPSYLIPAFSAVFLGATQFSSGRFNPWGTLVTVFMLGTGSVGLLLAGAPQWSPQLFEGVILILAVAITVRRGRRRAGSR
jgi:ribose transport system permease protein